jgi:tetratricopeptide (TPR) repeat protein
MFIATLALRRYRRYVSRFAVLGSMLVLVTLLLNLPSLFTSEINIPTVNRFSSSGDLDNSNNFRRLMITLSGEMIRENPVLGIGADNFGMQVNNYRQAYGAKNPSDVNLANAEDQIPSHAHNEYLQLTAELGLVGAAIMTWLLFGILVLAYRSLCRLRSGSLYPAAAVMGLGAFLLSSLVSSYSFRVMQNGIVFFFVLAFASKIIFRTRAEKPLPVLAPEKRHHLRLAFAGGMLVCIALLTYHGLRVSSVIVTARANQTRFLADAQPLFELAMRLDDENPDARHNAGMRLFRRQRYAEAAEYLESAIRLGRGPSSELSYLATAHELAGDPARAESTMRTTCELYPRSAFALTRFATILEANGKTFESASLFERARSIDERAALSWRAAIDEGPKALSDMAARDKSYMHLMELNPQSSIYAVVTERYLKHPEEQRFSLVKLTLTDE